MALPAFLAAALPYLEVAAYTLTAATAAKALTTDTPTNKMQTPGGAQGGPAQANAQSVFLQGQPTPQQLRMNTNPIQVQRDPAVQAQINALALGAQPPLTSPEPDPIPPLTPGDIDITPQTPAYAKPDIGSILAGIGNAADALGKVAPLLGLTDSPPVPRQMAGAAGGQGGQSVFAMPQRQTLAQILASLPR